MKRKEENIVQTDWEKKWICICHRDENLKYIKVSIRKLKK